MKSEGKKFVVDSMLGNLAKWLRIMGYDTLYSRVYSDWQILRVARSSGRIIVTRDRGLYWRARKLGLRAVLIESLNTVERLAELSSKAGVRLELNPSRSRCPLCNGNLVEVKDKALVKDRVPEGSYNSVDRFFVCDRCGKVYWEGSHWRNMKKTLEEAAKLKRSGGFML